VTGYIPWLTAKVDFAIDVLYQIASVEELTPLREALILKGGAAILLGYDGVRASRNDLDFGMFTNTVVTDDLVAALLLALTEGQWSAQLDDSSGNPIERFPDGSVNVLIAFRHPENAQKGRFKLQVSGRPGTVPPRLADRIKPRVLKTYDGTEFSFSVMSPEEIVLEKMFRLFNPRKAARHEDLFDIGWLTAKFSTIATGDLVDVKFHANTKEEHSVVRRDRIDQLLATNVSARYAESPEFGNYSHDRIVQTVLAGASYVLKTARLQ
jgi:predicted nucleotidyltransferase component of viral defense system